MKIKLEEGDLVLILQKYFSCTLGSGYNLIPTVTVSKRAVQGIKIEFTKKIVEKNK